MRNISFALTTEAIRNQTKTVTRRLGWLALEPGTLLQPVVKAQGLKKGAQVEKIGGPIRVVSVERQKLLMIAFERGGVAREGFPGKSWTWFVQMFREANGCDENATVTRIEFEYVEASR